MKNDLQEYQADLMTRINGGIWSMRPNVLRGWLARKMHEIESNTIREPAPIKQLAHVECQNVQGATLGIPKSNGAVVVVPLRGVIDQHRSWLSDISCDELAGMLQKLVSDESVGAIVLAWDSPGGNVLGVPELGEQIRELRAVKPIYSIADAEAYSAAYWLGSASTKMFVMPSGGVGSIGVWTMHVDASQMFKDAGWDITLISAGKYKVEGNPYEPLTDEARDAIQEDVDQYYDMFAKAVAKNRGVSVQSVRADYGEGRTVMAKDALSKGMVDGIATLPELLGALVPKKRGSARATAEAAIAMAEADIDVDMPLTASQRGATQFQAVVPSNPPGGSGEGVEGVWTKPILSDFTEEQWEDLDTAERRKIATYFGWYDTLDTFGNLKLPHHFPPNHEQHEKASLAGVRNALARLGQVQGIPEGERERCQTHLSAHLPEED